MIITLFFTVYWLWLKFTQGIFCPYLQRVHIIEDGHFAKCGQMRELCKIIKAKQSISKLRLSFSLKV